MKLSKKMREILGFTLTEIIVVIAVIAILAAITIPVFTSMSFGSNDDVDEMYSQLNEANASQSASGLEGEDQSGNGGTQSTTVVEGDDGSGGIPDPEGDLSKGDFSITGYEPQRYDAETDIGTDKYNKIKYASNGNTNISGAAGTEYYNTFEELMASDLFYTNWNGNDVSKTTSFTSRPVLKLEKNHGSLTELKELTIPATTTKLKTDKDGNNEQSVTENNYVVIDLNGFNFCGTITNYARLEIINSKTGGGIIDGGAEAALINYGVIGKISNATFKSTGKAVEFRGGTMNDGGFYNCNMYGGTNGTTNGLDNNDNGLYVASKTGGNLRNIVNCTITGYDAIYAKTSIVSISSADGGETKIIGLNDGLSKKNGSTTINNVFKATIAGKRYGINGNVVLIGDMNFKEDASFTSYVVDKNNKVVHTERGTKPSSYSDFTLNYAWYCRPYTVCLNKANILNKNTSDPKYPYKVTGFQVRENKYLTAKEYLDYNNPFEERTPTIIGCSSDDSCAIFNATGTVIASAKCYATKHCIRGTVEVVFSGTYESEKESAVSATVTNGIYNGTFVTQTKDYAIKISNTSSYPIYGGTFYGKVSTVNGFSKVCLYSGNLSVNGNDYKSSQKNYNSVSNVKNVSYTFKSVSISNSFVITINNGVTKPYTILTFS